MLSWPALSSAGTGRPRMTRSSLRWCGRENQSWRSPPGCGAARTPSSTAQNSSWATTSQVPHTRQNPGNRSGLNLDQRERTCATRGFSALRQPLPSKVGASSKPPSGLVLLLKIAVCEVANCRQGRGPQLGRPYRYQSTNAITPITIAVLTAKVRNRVCSVTGRRYHPTVRRP